MDRLSGSWLENKKSLGDSQISRLSRWRNASPGDCARATGHSEVILIPVAGKSGSGKLAQRGLCLDDAPSVHYPQPRPTPKPCVRLPAIRTHRIAAHLDAVSVVSRQSRMSSAAVLGRIARRSELPFTRLFNKISLQTIALSPHAPNPARRGCKISPE